MRSYPVKENPICSAVTEILRYKQTDKRADIVLLCIIDEGVASNLPKSKLQSYPIIKSNKLFCLQRRISQTAEPIWFFYTVKPLTGYEMVLGYLLFLKISLGMVLCYFSALQIQSPQMLGAQPLVHIYYVMYVQFTFYFRFFEKDFFIFKCRI